jgi:Golgi phosphoprotein 3
MGEGLTRRRAGGGATGSPTTGSSDQIPSSSNNNPSSSSGNKSNSNAPSSSVEGRSRVAYDPRDFQDDAESNKMPRLTLMEEVLLLGLKDKAVSSSLPLSCVLDLGSRSGD